MDLRTIIFGLLFIFLIWAIFGRDHGGHGGGHGGHDKKDAHGKGGHGGGHGH